MIGPWKRTPYYLKSMDVTVTSAEFGTSATGVTTDRAFYDPDRNRARA